MDGVERKMSQMSRRDMLKLGLLGSAALMLPLERTARAEWSSGDRLPSSQLPEPFQVPFAAPPVLQPVRSDDTTDYFQMTMRSARVPIIPGRPDTEIYGYDGVSPGPTIKVGRGRRAVVRQINALPEVSRFGYKTTTSVHLHGNQSAPQYDGYAEDVTAPGQYKDYVFPNDQDERMLWYHDHAIHHTAQNAYMGLAGAYVTDEQLALPIPKGRYDVPLVVRDAIFDAEGQLVFDDDGQKSLYGDVVLVNGRPWPVMRVERRKYRFRLLNASLSRSYKLALSTGDPMTVIGTDAGLMPAPRQAGSFRFGMAERYEIVIDFAKYPIGAKVDLKNLGLPNNENFASTENVMRFEVAGEATDTSNNEVPSELNTNMEVMGLTASQAVRTRTWTFDHSWDLGWTINGKIWDKNRVDARPALGDIEIWEFKNRSSRWFHPIHVHLVDFKILSRNGNAPFGYEKGSKDVVYVGEDETVRVIAKFGPRKGKYMIHCHNLVHEDHDMMTQFEVGTGGPDPVTTAPPKALPAPPL